jgi:hypothetical protein
MSVSLIFGPFSAGHSNYRLFSYLPRFVIPAKAGIQKKLKNGKAEFALHNTRAHAKAFSAKAEYAVFMRDKSDKWALK